MHVEQFVSRIAVDFDLGEVSSFSKMRGSANRLWRFSTSGGDFVVKELPYDSVESLSQWREAASFEARLIRDELVVAPDPIRDQDGEFISIRTSSRGSPSAVRVHRWFEGQPPLIDDRAVLAQAGSSLRAIQEAGQSWSDGSRGSLLWWDGDAPDVLDRFSASGYLDGLHLDDTRRAIADALCLIRAGASIEGDWTYTHCDHKPENCLSQRGVVAVLDWDECGHCHPRLEAVESALRWAGSADPVRHRFAAFMDGYNVPGQSIERLQEHDFAKWLAALVGWFAVQARRSMGDWTDVTEDERASAARMASDALMGLRSSLSALPEWTRLI